MRRWMAFPAAGVFLLAAFGGPSGTWLGALDQAVADGVAGWSEQTRHRWDLFSDVVGYGLAGAVLAWSSVAAFRTRRWSVLQRQGALVAVWLAVGLVLKPLFGRARPETALSDSHAFPSGHTTAAVAFAAAILMDRPTPRRWLLVGVIAALTASARVLAGEHWVTDVAASLALGAVAVAALAPRPDQAIR